MPGESLGATIFSDLDSLLIIANSWYYKDDKRFKEDIARWMKWVSPYLKCFRKHIPDTLSATVDDDDREVARELVQKYLPHCRRQPSAPLDFIPRLWR